MTDYSKYEEDMEAAYESMSIIKDMMNKYTLYLENFKWFMFNLYKEMIGGATNYKGTKLNEVLIEITDEFIKKLFDKNGYKQTINNHNIRLKEIISDTIKSYLPYKMDMDSHDHDELADVIAHDCLYKMKELYKKENDNEI